MKKVVLLFVAVCYTAFSFAQDAAEKLNQAQEALKAQDYAKAYTLYDEAMNNIGDVQVDASVNFNIGYAAYKAENLEGAIKYLDIAIAGGTNVAKCHEYKALAYNDKKDYKNAVACFEQAIAASDEDTQSLVFNAAIAAYKGKLYEKAIGFFTTSVESGYKGETAQYYKAAVYNKLNKDDEYKATLVEGVEKFPGDKKMAPALAKVYVSEGNKLYKKGAAILSAANQKVNAGGMTTADDAYVAEVAKAKKEFAAAIEVLEKALALDAENANATKLLEACKALN